ncbi:MAG TPA: hypothetical protein PKO06_22080, partial [Candidatus Ozemobacteraceae bacterium]|nr:hypothetical protein [Candidatus Ozemobacteraceae bacterium]
MQPRLKLFAGVMPGANTLFSALILSGMLLLGQGPIPSFGQLTGTPFPGSPTPQPASGRPVASPAPAVPASGTPATPQTPSASGSMAHFDPQMDNHLSAPLRPIG